MRTPSIQFLLILCACVWLATSGADDSFQAEADKKSGTMQEAGQGDEKLRSSRNLVGDTVSWIMGMGGSLMGSSNPDDPNSNNHRSKTTSPTTTRTTARTTTRTTARTTTRTTTTTTTTTPSKNPNTTPTPITASNPCGTSKTCFYMPEFHNIVVAQHPRNCHMAIVCDDSGRQATCPNDKPIWCTKICDCIATPTADCPAC